MMFVGWTIDSGSFRSLESFHSQDLAYNQVLNEFKNTRQFEKL
jgi:hypothetical protein